jgi:hypothetical protein
VSRELGNTRACSALFDELTAASPEFALLEAHEMRPGPSGRKLRSIRRSGGYDLRIRRFRRTTIPIYDWCSMAA